MQTCINILDAKRHKHSLFHQTYAMVVRNEKHDFPWLQKGHSSLMTTKDMDTTSIFPKAKACIGLPVKFCHSFCWFPTCDGPTKQPKHEKKKCKQNGVPQKSLKIFEASLLAHPQFNDTVNGSEIRQTTWDV